MLSFEKWHYLIITPHIVISSASTGFLQPCLGLQSLSALILDTDNLKSKFVWQSSDLLFFWLLPAYTHPKSFVLPILQLDLCWFCFFSTIKTPSSLTLKLPLVKGFSVFLYPECTVISWQPHSHYRTGEACACHNDTHPESITTVSNADISIFQE